jgi:hypothetical protein
LRNFIDQPYSDVKLSSYNISAGTLYTTGTKKAVDVKVYNYGILCDSVFVEIKTKLTDNAIGCSTKKFLLSSLSFKVLTFTIDPNQIAAGTQNVTINVISRYSAQKLSTINLKFTVADTTTFVNGNSNSNDLISFYPNPSKESITFSYSLPCNSFVRLSIVGMNGQLIANLINGQQVSGKHEMKWNGYDSNNKRLRGGIYLFSFNDGLNQKSGKIIIE